MTPVQLDSHYTPADLARIVVAAARANRPKVVADFAAGEGSLLRAANERWPTAEIVGTDISRSALRRLGNAPVPIKTGRCDFLEYSSRERCRVLRRTVGTVSVALLNPPFTSRGGPKEDILTPIGLIPASSSMAFVMQSFQYLADDAEIVAILPLGALHNNKDATAWEYIKCLFSVEILDRWSHRSFPGCAASSALVRLHSQQTVSPTQEVERRLRPNFSVRLVRGNCPAHTSRRPLAGPELVHTSQLLDGRVTLSARRGFDHHRTLVGPAVLIPRVGRLTSSKICVLGPNRRVMLSDCVFALTVKTPKTAADLRKWLVSHCEELNESYVGTGAPHITIVRLRAALGDMGVATCL